MQPAAKKQALGRGLSALFEVENSSSEIFSFIPINEIALNPYQPRQNFDPSKLEDLVNSVREKGVLQPLLVRESLNGYELIAGERRLRAAEKTGLKEVPCRILKLSDEESLEIALLENVQRADLNCLEEAAGYLKLINEFSYTQEMLSKKIGKSRSHIANSLRLLSLPKEIQELLQSQNISAGHAKCLIGTEDPIRLAEIIVSEGLNVRQSEDLVRKSKTDSQKNVFTREIDMEELALAQQLTDLTGLKAKVFLKKIGGIVQFFFETPSDFDRFLDRLNKKNGIDT
ncbi:MAG: ParB/RepB/Spo0J family partition protein [Alphaproteobacteria bacterium]